MKRTKLILMFIVLISAFFLNGCGEELVQEDMSPDKEEIVEDLDPADGGNLKLSITRFNTANPLFNSNRSIQQIQHLIYEGLITFDDQINIAPALAEKWTMAEDGQSLELTLRNNVKWHDGEPLTAEDVVFTFQLIKGNIKDIKGQSVYRTSLQYVSDMKVIDEGKLMVTFSKPFGNALEVMGFPIIPKHLFMGSNINKLTNEEFPIVGTGPFQLEVHQRMKELELKKNTAYWGQKPYIDTIEVVIVPDGEAELSLFENGDLDFARPLSVDWGKYANNKRVNVYEYVGNNYEFIGFNFRNRLLQNQNVRKAFAYGIDRHKLVKNIYLNHATVTELPINPQSWLNDGNGLQYGYDINTSKFILENQGFSLQEDKLLRKNEDGDTLRFRLITNKGNLLREKTAYFIQEEMAEIGIQIEVEFLEWDAFNIAMETGSFDIVLGGWELSHVSDLSFAFHSSQIGRTNFVAYQNEQMDNLLDEVARTSNPEEKLKNYQKLNQHIIDELPYFSLFFQNNAILVRNHIKGDKEPSGENIYKGIEHWYINTK